MSKPRQPRRDRHYLADTAEAIQRILEYTRGLTYDDFLNLPMAQDAVLRNVQVIGEATKKLSTELREAHPELPWRNMAGMQDKIVPAYFGVDYQIVWEVVQSDLPGLVSPIEGILQAQDRDLGDPES